ncbi:MAG: multiple antibiotic resistance protein [Acidobacteriaceae bacterium]|nr:multiple antibiotic resistance protein [Acidobacteriaceae bacterium]
MQEALKNLLLVLVTLFPIVDPLGGSPFFLALTKEYSPEARKALSWRIALNSFLLLVATYFVGTYVLAFFGISLPVVQVGGGLIVIATGWTLLKQRDDEKQDVQETIQPQDIIRRAFYPLTLPLTVGPGSNLRGDHAGRERGSPSRLPSFDNSGGTHGIGADRDQHFALLWICRPVGANPGSNGDDGDHTIVILFPGLYRCTDCLERD